MLKLTNTDSMFPSPLSKLSLRARPSATSNLTGGELSDPSATSNLTGGELSDPSATSNLTGGELSRPSATPLQPKRKA